MAFTLIWGGTIARVGSGQETDAQGLYVAWLARHKFSRYTRSTISQRGRRRRHVEASGAC